MEDAPKITTAGLEGLEHRGCGEGDNRPCFFFYCFNLVRSCQSEPSK